MDHKQQNLNAVIALRKLAETSYPTLTFSAEQYPIYGTSEKYPGLIVEYHEDGSITPGRLIDGQFVAITINE